MKLWLKALENLEARLHLLDSDFQSWRDKSRPTGELKQHHTQVRRVTDVLKGVIKSTFPEAPFQDKIAPPNLAHLPDLRRAVGSVHVIWDFFRNKFAQREVTHVATHLGVADDFAWELYQPFLDAASSVKLDAKNVSEPPLVFYSPYRFPYAQARTKQYEPPGIEAKDFKKFVEVLIRLPVPVIAVPWFSVNRLPDLVLVGHETGHVVAEDFGLAREAKSLIEKMQLPADTSDERRRCWLAWIDEVFADIFGVLASGRAFVASLAGEMAGDRTEVRHTKINRLDPGEYPTPALRIALCETVLHKASVTPDGAWAEAYGDLAGDSTSFQKDVPLIVDAVLNQQWQVLGGKTLEELVRWSAALENQAEEIATATLKIAEPPGPFSVRSRIAGAMLASQKDPTVYLKGNLDNWIAEGIVAQRKVAVRSIQAASIRSRAIAAAEPEQAKPLVQADEELGLDIAKSLGLLNIAKL